jgi:hypothetical protein
MNEERLQVIEERRKHANGMNITNAVHDSDACTHADYTFVEWALEDVSALIAEVRSLRDKLDAVPVMAILQLTKDATNDAWSRKALQAVRKWLKTQEPQS